MKRIAFIDLGSNSVRFVIMSVCGKTRSHKLIYQQKESIRLSEGLSEEGKLMPAAIKRAIFALKTFSRIAKHMHVSHTIAVATAAVRLASNGNDFIRLVFEETGFVLHAISGDDEARYGFLGVMNTMDLSDAILFDLGGASMEVTLVKHRKLQKTYSFPMGALTLTEKFTSSHTFQESDIHAMKKFIKSLFNEERWLRHVKLPLIGIGGTVRNIAKIDQRAKKYPIYKIHNYEMQPDTLIEMQKNLLSMPSEERRKVPGLSSERTELIIPGLIMISELMKYTKAPTLYVSGCGLREGLFYDFYGNTYAKGNVLSEDVLMDSCLNFLHNSGHEVDAHLHFVNTITDELFQAWAPLHKEGPRMRQLLAVASLLHDVGKTVNYYSHARHSAYVILNAPLYGLSHREQAMCAFMASFSHGITMKDPKVFFSSQLLDKSDWKTVRQLSLLLAIAEALDASYEQGVHFLTSTFDSHSITLHVHVKKETNTDLFTFSLEKLTKQVRREYNRTLHIVLHKEKGIS